MEFEDRNPKPAESSKNIPLAVLFTLIGIVCLLLWVGWKYLSDEASTTKELSEVSNPIQNDSLNTNVTENTEIAVESETIEPNTTEESKISETKTEEPEKIASASAIGNESYSYTVAENETFLGIANRFNLTQDQLKNANPGVDIAGLKVGVTKLSIPVQKVHTVGPGDILRVVAKKYDISVDEIMTANKKKKNFSERGEKLVIPIKK